MRAWLHARLSRVILCDFARVQTTPSHAGLAKCVARRLQFAKELNFAVVAADDPTVVLEEYIFAFDYGGSASFRISAGKPGAGAGVAQGGGVSASDIKAQVGAMVRSLCAIMQTLEALPDEVSRC